MKIRTIELLETTENYFLTKITFEKESFWVIREIVESKCYSKKDSPLTYFLDTGEMIPTYLHGSVRVFLETGKESMKLNEEKYI